jgi:hypothetical protein
MVAIPQHIVITLSSEGQTFIYDLLYLDKTFQGSNLSLENLRDLTCPSFGAPPSQSPQPDPILLLFNGIRSTIPVVDSGWQ